MGHRTAGAGRFTERERHVLKIPGSSLSGAHAVVQYTIWPIDNSRNTLSAAEILFDTFQNINKDSWPTLASAIKEVNECLSGNYLCTGICVDGNLAGWAGLRPLYEKTWELHPMVIKTELQRCGLGEKLLTALEEQAREKDIIGIALGTDDETDSTSISQSEINADNVLDKIASIRNLKNHPYEFYKKCGYTIVGIIPNANGINKPDIWMWKNISKT